MLECSSPLTRFILGIFVMIGSLCILGLPIEWFYAWLQVIGMQFIGF